MATIKRKALSIETKLQILSDVDKRTMAKKDIAAKYGIPHNSLSTIIKNREKIESADFDPQRKRQRTATNVDVDKAVLSWFKQTRAINAPTSGPIIMEQANLLADKLGANNFTANNGWLSRFKSRHGIVFKTACGEAASVDTTSVEAWKRTALVTLLESFSPQDIFNADETGLFFRCLPNKTHAFTGDVCHGGKQAKDRLTVLIASNMTGTEKLPLLVIGKSANPRCFKNVSTKPGEYVANSKAWMTATIFEAWLRKLDRKFLLQGRSIAMVVDNCPAHPKLTDLKAIQLEFLPPNTTSHTQPCDQGIINAFKRHYRTKVVQQYLSYINDSASALSQETVANFHISLLDALFTMRWAWNMVSAETISNCFRHAGFQNPKQNQTPPQVEEECEQSSELECLLGRLGEKVPIDMDSHAYISIDEQAEISCKVSIDDIAADVMDKSSPDDDEDDCTARPCVSGKEALAAIDTLRIYAQQHCNGEELFDVTYQAEDKVRKMMTCAQRQTTISDFFTRF